MQPRKLRLGPGRYLTATPVLDTYWRFAAARQQVFHRRVRGELPPWTDDCVIAEYRFTNPYRASDRVSQYLIRQVQYTGAQAPAELFFRTLLFKFFNRIETWEGLLASLGHITWEEFDVDRYASVLDSLIARGPIYSAAYIMPSPPFGAVRKHRNHLLLLERMMKEELPKRVGDAGSLKELFQLLERCPSLGRFLAFQFAVDLNYSEICDFDEKEFVVAGPGAQDGISKCFSDTGGLSDEQVIQVVTDIAAEEFQRLGLTFDDLWGRPLQLIDCQNLFCEVAKYARIVHPEYAGRTGRSRIKQKYRPTDRGLPQWYPPKWGLALPVQPVEPRDRYRPTKQLEFGSFVPA
jgi:hypothetical protein